MLPNSLITHFQHLRNQGKKITLVTGVFDLLHQEHCNFLQKASQVGDVLVVGIESDIRVRKMKGEGRPIETQAVRQAHIEALGLAETVFILPEDFSKPEHHDQLIAEIRPAYLAVSSHTAHQESKKAIMAKYGGELKIVHQHNPAISTTVLEKKLAQK